MRSFSLFLALRYLQPKRTFISIITLISILGVTLGITVLILVISVMTGFDRELQNKVLGFEPHIVISNDDLLQNWREISKEIEKEPGVVAVAPFVQGPVIVEMQGRVITPVMRGIDPVSEEKINDLKKLVKQGTFDLSGDTTVMGSLLAAQLGVNVGDKITVYAPNNIRGIIEELRREEADPKAKAKTLADLKGDVVLPAELTVTGIFESGRYEYDSNILLVPLYVGQELYGLGDSVHGLSVRTTDPYLAVNVKNQLSTKLHDGVYAQTWIDRNSDRFDAVRLERNMMFFILFFIVIVAAFSIMNTLITVTVQKRREIGILKALGANVWQIVWVFLAQGMVVGFFGNVIGLGLGMTLIRFRNEFKDWLASVLHIEIFPASIYEFSKIPAVVEPRDVAIICIGAFVICSVASLIPAYFAAKLDPVKALRYE